jgi:hypothetical protein
MEILLVSSSSAQDAPNMQKPEVYRQKHRTIVNLLIDNIGEMPT